jgi:hypothetical protein
MERPMDSTVLDCGTHTWFMIAGGVLTYGVLALVGAALIKYLFFSTRDKAAA